MQGDDVHTSMATSTKQRGTKTRQEEDIINHSNDKVSCGYTNGPHEKAITLNP